jgi:hypothetical protein
MNIAIYRDIEVRLEHLPNDVVRVELCLPGRAITFECRSEAIAIAKAKILIDKRLLGLPDPDTD